MNFREHVLTGVFELIDTLRVGDSAVRTGPTSEITFIDATAGNASALRDVRMAPTPVISLPLSPQEPIPQVLLPPPLAYVYFDSGRHDLGVDTFNTHLVEVLAIRIDVILSTNAGVEVNGQVRRLTLQASDILSDFDRLLTVENLRPRVSVLDHVTVQEVVMEEWEFDQRYRGGPLEVLTVILQAEVANPRQTNGG